MISDQAVLAVIGVLERTDTPYMIVGSLSCNVYTIARSTKDADFVIQLRAEQADELMGELRSSFQVEPQGSFETVTGTRRYVVESLQTGFKIELFLLAEDAHDQMRFSRRRQVHVEGRQAWVAAAEDVVITKLRWSRQGQRAKDLDDARNVISSQAARLDWDYIHRWCDEHGTRKLLDETRASIPKND